MASPQGRLLGLVFDNAQRRFASRDAAGAERMGERMGLLAYRIDRKHRERAEANLRLAFPEHDDAWARETARESFRHFGRLAGDLMRSPARTNAEVLATMTVTPSATRYFEEAQGVRGAILCTGHVGNWERAAHWVTAGGFKLSVVMRPVNQPSLQDRIEGLRRAAGIDLLSRGDAAVGMMRKLRRGEFVAVLPDQNSGEGFVPFFGHPTGTVMGPAVMAKRTGSWILPAFCLRTGPGEYRLDVHAPIDAKASPLDAREIMAEYYQALEAAVRQAPEQYLWMHDRWKSARKKGMV